MRHYGKSPIKKSRKSGYGVGQDHGTNDRDFQYGWGTGRFNIRIDSQKLSAIVRRFTIAQDSAMPIDIPRALTRTIRSFVTGESGDRSRASGSPQRKETTMIGTGPTIVACAFRFSG